MFKIWTPKEEEELLNEYKQITIDEISVKHTRSKKAIEVRLQDIAVRMHLDNKTDEEILSSTGVNKETLLKRKESKDKEREKKCKEKEQQMLSKVADIYSESSNSDNQDTNITELRLEIKELRLEVKEMKLVFKELYTIISNIHKE